MNFDPDKQLTVQSLPNEQSIDVGGLQAEYTEISDILFPPADSISYYGIGFEDYETWLRPETPIVLYYWYSEDHIFQEVGIVSSKQSKSDSIATFTIKTTVSSYTVEVPARTPKSETETDIAVYPEDETTPLATTDIHVLPIEDHYVAMATGNGHLTTATQL